MPLSPYADQAVLNSMFGKTSNFGALASVPTIYVGLSSTTPSVSGSSVTGITEPSSGAYARVATAASDWNSATEAAPAVLTNLNAVTFPAATADWASGANMTYFVLYDAATAGNVLAFGSLSTSAAPVLNTQTAEFAAGALSVNNQ